MYLDVVKKLNWQKATSWNFTKLAWVEFGAAKGKSLEQDLLLLLLAVNYKPEVVHYVMIFLPKYVDVTKCLPDKNLNFMMQLDDWTRYMRILDVYNIQIVWNEVLSSKEGSHMTAFNAFAKQLECHYASVFDVYVQVNWAARFFVIKKCSLKQARKRSTLLPPLSKPPSFQKAGRRLDWKKKKKELEGTAGIVHLKIASWVHFMMQVCRTWERNYYFRKEPRGLTKLKNANWWVTFKL